MSQRHLCSCPASQLPATQNLQHPTHQREDRSDRSRAYGPSMRADPHYPDQTCLVCGRFLQHSKYQGEERSKPYESSVGSSRYYQDQTPTDSGYPDAEQGPNIGRDGFNATGQKTYPVEGPQDAHIARSLLSQNTRMRYRPPSDFLTSPLLDHNSILVKTSRKANTSIPARSLPRGFEKFILLYELSSTKR